MAKFTVNGGGHRQGQCRCDFRIFRDIYEVASGVCVCVCEENEMAFMPQETLTEYGLQHSRYEEHCLAAELVR